MGCSPDSGPDGRTGISQTTVIAVGQAPIVGQVAGVHQAGPVPHLRLLLYMCKQ
jgi:hypothetical protein